MVFDAVRRKETADFFAELDQHVQAADDLEELIVSIAVTATRLLREDEHLQVMLASKPGEVLSRLGFADLPRIIESATEFLRPRCARFLGPRQSAELAEFLTRSVLSFFFTPSEHLDLGDPVSARHYAHRFVLPAFTPPEVLK